MTLNKTIASVLAGAAALAAVPALAGPIGEGRPFTVETANKHAAQRTVKVAAVGGSCLSQAAAALKARDDVEGASVKSGEVHVTFRTPAHAAAGEAEVRSAVSKACA